MNLGSKQAMVFAATGAIGSEVARTFARQGAHVWLSGRNAAALEDIAAGINAAGGSASFAIVDATDSAAVQAYVDRVAAQTGRIDIVFNAIGGHPSDLGYPALSTTQPFEDFMTPLRVILGSTFLTARAAGGHMLRQGSGSIVTLSATLSGMTSGYMAGISAACGAIEALTRSLAGEFGPAGVRVNCVRGSAMPETRTIQETAAGQARVMGISMAGMQLPLPPLGRMITVAETASAAAFLASDAASGMTGQVLTVCAGAFVG